MKSRLNRAIDTILIAANQASDGAETCQVYARQGDVAFFESAQMVSEVSEILTRKGLRLEVVIESDEMIALRISQETYSIALILAAKTIEMMGGDSTRMSIIKSLNTANLLCENSQQKAASLIREYLGSPITEGEASQLVDYLEMGL